MRYPNPESITSVAELTGSIKRLLEDEFAVVWVKGEISNLRNQSSGHVYFTLKDDGAQISCVMFRREAMKLDFLLKDGMEVLVLANLSVYEPRGNYQLIVRECIESGVGQLQVAFERLKSKLEAEGLFDSDRKSEIPNLPQSIGVITSPTGAALKDFISILNRRDWRGNIYLFPAIVQGKEGAASICSQLALAETFPELELLILARGGGSLEDLWNFNEESVVRAVANSKLPMISAVGHEIDFTLCDFAADKRAETPSAAAELISSAFVEIRERTSRLKRELTDRFRRMLGSKSEKIDQFSRILKLHSPNRLLENLHLRLDDHERRLSDMMQNKVSWTKEGLSQNAQRLDKFAFMEVIDRHREDLKALQARLSGTTYNQFNERKSHTQHLEKQLNSLGVNSVLSRGFSIVRGTNNRVYSSSNETPAGEKVIIQWSDGTRKAELD